MKKTTICLLLTLWVTSMCAQQYVWTKKANFGGGGRYGAFGFSIGNKGYIGSGVGYSAGSFEYTYVDFWEYDPAVDAWTQKADLPGSCILSGSGFSVGTKGYVTLGWTPTQIDDTYEYDPSLNTWTQKANYGGGARYTAANFVIGSFAYVGMGYAPLHSDFWKYDPSNDTWTQVADIGGPLRQSASGFTIDTLGYVFGGGEQFSLQSSELWRYDPSSNLWLQMASMPDTGRNAGTAFSLDGYGFVGTGGNDQTTFSDFWKYDPSTDSWEEIAGYGGGKRNTVVSFVIGNKAYAGTGSEDIYPNLVLRDDFWEFYYTDANNITGNLFYDFNNNQTQDVGEPVIPNQLVYENNSGRIAFSNQYGNYNLSVLDSGNFQVTTDAAGYFAPIPAIRNVNFNNINTVDSLNDFAFQAATSINDLEITISPIAAFRPGFDAHYNITINNLGTTNLTPVVLMYLDTNVTFVSSTFVPATTGADTIVWNLPVLSPFQITSFQVTVNVDASTPIGTEINCPVIVEPIANDINTYNNYDSWPVIVTGSFDPNDIAVNLPEITTTQLPSQPWLEYLIRFQNTGTDTAFTVDVTNAVPTGVDLSSFELMAASHPVVVSYNSVYNKFSFKFNNILLVDSNHNEALSHGFVRYRIKPLTTLTTGNTIENSAAIYFDFNAPVLTNTASTLIVNPTGIKHVSSAQHLVVSPTLVKDKLNIAAEVSDTYSVKIYAVNGKMVLNTYKKGKSVIDVKSFNKGIYYIEILCNNKKQVTKIIKD